MTPGVGNYTDWGSIDYQPHLAAILPDALIPLLPAGARVLEIGCNRGDVAFWLAERGAEVLGVDLNPAAIQQAQARAQRAPAGTRVRFDCLDVATQPLIGTYDAVTLIRVLTCFPMLPTWSVLLERVRSLLAPGGLLYVHDFVRDDRSAVYRERYAAGQRAGWRPGNFRVDGPDGQLMFVAHHHDQSEIAVIAEPYETVFFAEHKSLSMNGNPCTMFELVARRPRTDAAMPAPATHPTSERES